MRTIGPDSDDIAVRFTIRQMALGIAFIGVILALAVQAPCLLVAGGDAVLIGFGIYKLARVLLATDRPGDETPWPPMWFRIAIATALATLVLGLLIEGLWVVISD
jgi:hypothetical protein